MSDTPAPNPRPTPNKTEPEPQETAESQESAQTHVERAAPSTPLNAPPSLDRSDMPLPPKASGANTYSNPHNLPPLRRPGSPPPQAAPRKPGTATRHQAAPAKVATPSNPERTSYISGPPQASKKSLLQTRLASGMGCLWRGILISLIPLTILAILAAIFGVYQYTLILGSLPSVEGLHEKASTFETTRILDREGNVLYEILDPNAGRRTYVQLKHISPYLIAATIATEDKNFYKHPGFDWTAIVRAFWQNYQGETIVSGASTITQQLARNLLFTPEERSEQTYTRKVREALLAAELTRRYTKDEILELYLNESYYGNLAYGVEAAAQTYFGTTAGPLDLAQGVFLAGLPQSPAVYDVYQNRAVTFNRYADVLQLMVTASREQNCIDVLVQGELPKEICIDEASAVTAYNQLANYEFASPDVPMRYPHWVVYVKGLLEEMYGAQTIYRAGFTVYTTLDPQLQDAAQQIVSDQVAQMAANRAGNGALMAIRPSTGEILAMVGSADFYNEEIDGQVNMATTPTRQPGSSIKPLTYLAAFEKGWTPATLIWDVPTDFPPSGDPGDPRGLSYRPVNYDGRFHGPVTVRSALANSYNIPAVKALEYTGIYDDPATSQQDGLIGMARRLGITSFKRDDYGLALTLGGGEVSLIEMTGAYATIANGGRRVPPVAITRIQDFAGNLIYEYQVAEGEQVVRAEHTYLLTSILSDNQARAPMFGSNSTLALPFPAAAKTGTTDEFRDNWTMGFNPDIAVGAWVGNADNSPMINTTGLSGAAPIWAEFMQVAAPKLSNGNPPDFARPSGIIDMVICAASGAQPSSWCPKQRNEIFASDQPPLPPEEDLWARMKLDTWTGLKASSDCGDTFTEEYEVLNVDDPWAVKWINEREQGQAWAKNMGFEPPIHFAPERACKSDDPRPQLAIRAPGEGQMINVSVLDIIGHAYASGANRGDFARFQLDFGLGGDPGEWKNLTGATAPIQSDEKLYAWDLHDFPADGPITLKLRMESIHGGFAEVRVQIDFKLPTPTLIPSPTPTWTPTPTQTLLPTGTTPPTQTPIPAPTQTPVPTQAPPTYTPIPSTETETPVPSETTEGGLSLTLFPTTTVSAPATATTTP